MRERYNYTTENQIKDTIAENFLNSDYSNQINPNYSGNINLNKMIEKVFISKHRKVPKKYYFYCDRSSEHLLFFEDKLTIHIKISDDGLNGIINGQQIPLEKINSNDTVFCVNLSNIQIPNLEFQKKNCYSLLLSDPTNPSDNNRSLREYTGIYE